MAANIICKSCGESKTLYKPLFSKEQKGLEVLHSQITRSTGVGTRRITTVICHSCGYRHEFEDN
ncbi:MAG: hypothetical protein J1E62_00630 [Lachnospiraceae bacterium]|nr:hypothetical protein [Lachnospiraceae bacterium]